ncbi:MAG: hypothetical protein A2751_05955 [Candidatus Doudnabacteria bacterium RIFCSPHIGHO2_01_FULL_46_14]|uniref:Uncharacterized protein n=1 Tax=Candidatus Doudnabacteria bacterium RIFCSPHIGHO2_01_FULL_46_14 TaxID=1817824 RepID=A0A1F5NNK9_9BACT|nr:MAG: hypothetical protein A2751_05955 [Candidatus Doudnabacteria bacterium RIFCSPHIGHO2_01_FULL_46_14]
MARRRKPTVWEALNEPIIEVTEEQAKNIFLGAVFIISAAWIAPHWTAANNVSYYAPTNVFEQMASVADAEDGFVAGAQIVADDVAPEWYYMMEAMPDAVVESFAVGAGQVLDVSGPITEVSQFYQPGVDAVWNSWLNLMRDPGTPAF